jgi:uncharacterized membrane protein
MASGSREPWRIAAAMPANETSRAANEPLNVDVEWGERLSFGDIVADRVTREIGSWRFIVAYLGFLVVWVTINTVAWLSHWDPYPFIFLNLVLSFQGAFAAPIILMSQNRQEERDRLNEHYDHAVNRKAEREVAAMQAQIDELGRSALAELGTLRDEQRALHARIDALLARWERSNPTSPG